MLEHPMHKSIAETVGIGTINEVQGAAIGLYEVGYGSSIPPLCSFWSLKGICQYVDCLFVHPTGHKQIPSSCCPYQSALALAQLSECVWLEWIVCFAAKNELMWRL